MAEEEQLSE